MNTPVWAEALVSCAYYAAGVLTATLMSHKPPADKKALAYPADFLLGICAGALFIGVTELFFGGVTGVAAYSAYALGLATCVAAFMASEPVKREPCRKNADAKTNRNRKKACSCGKRRKCEKLSSTLGGSCPTLKRVFLFGRERR